MPKLNVLEITQREEDKGKYIYIYIYIYEAQSFFSNTSPFYNTKPTNEITEEQGW